MKKFFRSMAVVVLMVSGLSLNVLEAVAGEEFAYTLHPLNNSTKLYFGFNANPQHLPVEVRIKDQAGVVLHRETMSADKAAKVFDFQKLGRGVYLIEIKNGDFIQTKEVQIGEAVAEDLWTAKLSPMIKEGSIEVSYLNNNEVVTVRIIDADGNDVYHETSSIKAYRRKFNVSKLKAGSYTVKVAHGENSYEQSYTVR
jgi:Secretion system C-terminal sorting domain